MPGMGRLVSVDERDSKFPLRAAMVAAPRPRRTMVWPMFTEWLDQGNTSTCVGHGWRHLLTGTPRPLTSGPTPFEIYDAATKIDEWSDNDHDVNREFGTSVRAGAKVLKGLGLISEYRWAHTVDDVVEWLCWNGPLVAGTNWYNSMFYRNRDGFLRIPSIARVEGGHCTLWLGWDERRGAVRGLTSWKKFGYFWLSGETVDRLLHESGEACAPTETIVSPA